MGKYIIQEETLTSIADAIRAKTGETGAISVSSMSDNIVNMQSGGSDVQLKAIVDRTATEITLPSDVTKIGDYAFYSFDTLVNVTFNDRISYIGDSAFSHCLSLTIESLPDAVRNIGDYAFLCCENIAINKFPESLQTIGKEAFSECDAITNITFGSNLNDIKEYAFSECISLTEVTFNSVVSNISENTFSGCSNLKTINVPWAEGVVANAPWGATNATINYPSSNVWHDFGEVTTDSYGNYTYYFHGSDTTALEVDKEYKLYINENVYSITTYEGMTSGIEFEADGLWAMYTHRSNNSTIQFSFDEPGTYAIRIDYS